MRGKLSVLGLLVVFAIWATAIGAAQSNQSLQITNGPNVEHTDSNSAIVAWSTNTNASTVLKYGTDPNNLNQTAEAPWGGVTHRVTIKNLQPNTTYYFQVQSAQGQGTGTGAMSPVAQFRTSDASGQSASNQPGAGQSNSGAVQITGGPNVDYVADNQAKISWTTNAPSSTVVKYGTDPNLLNMVAEAPWGTTTHQVTLANLTPNTRYYYQIQSGQGKGTGTTAMSAPQSFQTVRTGQAAVNNPH